MFVFLENPDKYNHPHQIAKKREEEQRQLRDAITRKKGKRCRINNHECALQVGIIKINLLPFSESSFFDNHF